MDVSAASGTRIEAPAAQGRARLPLIDAVRGFAFIEMAIYHFAWDLRYFGYTATDVTVDLGWRIFARSIAATFLALVGVGLVLASRNGLNRARFLRRLGTVIVAAAGITLVTWFMFPEMFIFFGILHAIAVSSVLALPFVRAPIAAVAAAAVVSIALPWLIRAPLFDAPALLWLGLFTEPPRSVDFVPIFPWFGVVLAGIVAARIAPRVAPRALAGLASLKSAVLRPLAWAGRHSLVLYLVHQPLLFGLVYLAAQVAPPSLLPFEGAYVESCTAACAAGGSEPGLCARSCQCVADGVQADGFWRELMRDALSPEQAERFSGIADQCRVGGGG